MENRKLYILFNLVNFYEKKDSDFTLFIDSLF